MSSAAPDPRLVELRARIDELDRQLIDTLAQRLAICHEVAEVKESTDAPIIQPQRVRDVITSRRQMALDSGVDPDFAEEVMRVLLAETHRIEVAGRRPDSAPSKTAEKSGTTSSADVGEVLDTVASRIDHVVIAVPDLAAATASFATLGFHPVDPRAPHTGVEVVRAGGVTLVLVSPVAGANVARHLGQHGPGIHHVAIEVLNAGYAREALDQRSRVSSSPNITETITEIITDRHGHEQFFTVRDEASGTQLGFIARTGHRVGIAGIDIENILTAFND